MRSVLDRLQMIEEYIGLDSSLIGTSLNDAPNDDMAIETEDEDIDPALNSLWQALGVLRKVTPSSVDNRVWNKARVRELWLSYVNFVLRAKNEQLIQGQVP
jgi:hypothetical protein